MELPRVSRNVMGKAQNNKLVLFFHLSDKGKLEIQAGAAVLSIARFFLSGLCCR